MILPTKHIKLSNSLLNLGAVLLNNLNDRHTVTLLWDKTRILSEGKTFERFTLGLDLLFLLELVEFQEGLLVKVRQ